MPIETTEWSSVVGSMGRSFFNRAPIRILALLSLLTLEAVYESVHITAVRSTDIWWHLRIGLWMLQNHAFPHVGLFSQHADRPWVASNWLFDILASLGYRLLGLKVLPALLISFKIALAWVTFILARGWSGNFWGAVLLSAAGQYAIVDLPPLPIAFSILFFGVELFLLLQSRRCGDVRLLFWLPALFFIWANLDGQFLNGLLLLGIFLVAEAAEFLLLSSGTESFSAPHLFVRRVIPIAGISLGATLLTPYSFHLYASALQTTYGKVLFDNFPGMQALGFRRPQDFVLLLLAMAAFLVLGKQRTRDVFKLSVLVIFLMLAFRIQRDVWGLVLPAIAIIGDALVDVPFGTCSPRWKWEKPVLAGVTLVVFMATIVRLPNTPVLMKQASRTLPVSACDFVRANHLPAPIFNAYSWGGFLMWYLPEYPVSIDGRLSLYGDELDKKYFKVTSGTERLETDPSFAAARTILFEQDSTLIKALTTLPALRDQFRVAYRDDVATVLVRR
jgi:hypothetical protein